MGGGEGPGVRGFGMRRKKRPGFDGRPHRQQDVPAEKILWAVVRDRALGGFKFRRQHPLGRFVTDFACVERKVILELDGESHLERTQQDQLRTQWLESEGWLVIRFWNNEIYDDLEAVKEAIYRACVKQPECE